MAWHGTVIRPIRAGRAGPVWFCVVPRECSRPLEGPHKRPGDWQKRKCLASRLLQISSPIRRGARCPGFWRAMRRGWARREDEIRIAIPIRSVGLTWSHQESRIPAAGGEEDGVVSKSPWSVASSSEKPALGRAWKLAGVCLAGVRKGGALFHQPSRNSPIRWSRLGGGLPRDHSTHPPFTPRRPSRPCAVYESTRGSLGFFSLCSWAGRLGLLVALIFIDGAPKVD